MKSFNLIYLFLFSCLFACKSTDTPQTFKIEINDIESPVSSSIRGISVIDSNIVWLSGAKGSILQTIDGGKTWNQFNSPDHDSLDFRSIHAFSSTSAIIVSAGFPARAYKTENRGTNWDLVYENLDSAAFMNSIAFKNENDGLILGDQLGNRHLVLQTNDGGNSWSRLDSNQLPTPLAIENGFAASNACITIDEPGNYHIGFGGEQVRVFNETKDAKFTAVTTTMKGGNSSGIYALASGKNKMMGLGGDYTTADSSHFPVISDDNGQTWSKTKSSVFGYRSTLDYSEKGNFWICGGSNGLDLSTNDGKDWMQFSFQDINTLQFLPGTTRAIAANSKGEIYLIDIRLTIK